MFTHITSFVLSLVASRRWNRASLVLLSIALLCGALVHPAGAAPAESRVLPQLQREAKEKPNQKFRVIVTRIKNNAGADRASAAAGGSKIKNVGPNAFAAMIPGRAIAALGRNPAVKFVTIDAPIVPTAIIDNSKLATFYPSAVNATKLWSSSITGEGVGVAVLDTGVNKALVDFNTATGKGSRVVAMTKFSSNASSSNDGHGHGSHVAGIIAGNSWNQKDGGLKGLFVGVAPEANLVNVKVSDDQGMSYISDVVNAIEWVIANRTTYNIRVMNMSFLSSVAESAKTSILAAAVERAWFSGILVVAAAGNSGPDTMQYPPANDPFVITVGASDVMGTSNRNDDGMAPWSSYGTTQDGFSKPDVVAPGRYMVAPLASLGSTLAKAMPDRVEGKGVYFRLSGTSMSTPVVAGLAALAFQAHPEWTNDQVKWLLLNTSTTLMDDKSKTALPLPGQGAGEVDANAVVKYTGIPEYANQGLTINEQLVTQDGTVVYDSANWSASNWSASNWSASNWSASNWSSSNWSASNWSTSSWSTSNWSANNDLD